MALTNVYVAGGNGIGYTYEVDSSADYSLVPNGSFFKDLSLGVGGMILYKDSTGEILEIYGSKFGGSGNINTVAKFTSANFVGNSNITDDGTLIALLTDATINSLNIGRGAGNLNSNTVFGLNAFITNTTGFQNVAIGRNSLHDNDTGQENVSIGSDALYKNISGSYSTALGDSALYKNTTGTHNVGLGYKAGYDFAGSTSKENTAIGAKSISAVTAGNNNVALGFEAGYYITGGATFATLMNTSVMIGATSKPNGDDQSNQIVIGYAAVGRGSNTATLGNNFITDTYLGGAVTINNAYKLPSVDGTAGYALITNGTGIVSWQIVGNVVSSGTTTTNRITKWTNTTGSLGNSQIADDGTSLAIGASLNATVQLGIATNKNRAISVTAAGIGVYGATTTGTAGVGVQGQASGGTGILGTATGTANPNTGVEGQATGVSTENIGGKFTATGAATNYSVQLIDGTQTVGGGKFLRDTGGGKANWANITLNDISGAHTGTGTPNYVTKWTGTASQGDSIIFDNGTNVGIGTITPAAKLNIVYAASAADGVLIQGGGGTLDNIPLKLWDLGTAVNNKNIIEFGHSSTYVAVSRIYSTNPGPSAISGGKLVLETTSDNIGTFNTNQLVLSNNGNIGIGVATPTAKLHINNAGSAFNSFLVEDAASVDATPFVITSTGDVGIGTATPSTKLTVVGNFKFGPTTNNTYFQSYAYGSELDISSSNSGGWSRANRIITSDTTSSIFFGAHGSNTSLIKSFWTIGDAAVSPTGYDLTTGIFLLKGGSVGIGVTNPSSTLQVGGDVKINTILNATTDTDKFLVSDAGVIKYRTGAELLSDIGGQGSITLTTTGSSGAATLTSGTLNIPNYTLAGLGGVASTRQLTINGVAYDLSLDRSWSVGTVTSISSFTLTSNGTNVTTGISDPTVAPSLTINIPVAGSIASRGLLSNTDWTNFNNKQNAITLTVLNNSGSATLVGSTLNIPTYTLAGLGGEPTITAGTTAQYWRGDKTWQTLNTTAVAEGTNLYFTEGRVRSTLLTGLNVSGGTIAATDSVLIALGKIQNQLNAVASPMIYQGIWNANTNTPTLTSGTGTKGYVYRVTTSGSTNIDGVTDWKSGDFIVFNGTTWDKWDATDAVTSVNGYTGAVVLTKSDVGLSNVENTALSTWPGTTNITTLGTIGTGVWQGTAIADAYIASAATWNAKVGGTGTLNYLPLWSSTTTLATSGVYQDPSTGNIGIGTSTPTTIFNIARSTTENFYVNLANTAGALVEVSTTDTTKRVRLIAGNNGNTVSIGQIGYTNTGGSAFGGQGDSYLASSADANNLNIVNQAGTGSTTDNIQFFAGISGTVSTATSSMVILGSGTNKGDVGIGITAPVEKLHIGGSFKVDTVGTVTVPASSPGWYRLATSSGGNRGAVKLIYSTTGGDYTPATFIIKAFKDWTTIGTIILEKYGSIAYIKGVRIVVDEIDSSVYHIEGDMASNTNGLIFLSYVEKTLGYESTWNVNSGTLPLSTSSATPIRYNTFLPISGGISSPNLLIKNNVSTNQWEFRDRATTSTAGVLNLIGSNNNIIMSWDDINTRVGIGLSSDPTAKLHINNITASDSFLVEDSTNIDASPFVIDAAGSVGVGLLTPGTFGRLVVQGSGANGVVLNTDSGTATNSTRLFFRQSDGNDVSMFNVNGSLRFAFNGTASATVGTSGDAKFIMTAAGSLLINATNPTISPVAPLTAYATGTASTEEIARFAIYDVNNPGTLISSFMSIRNASATDGEFVPQLRGLQNSTSTGSALDIVGLASPLQNASATPVLLLRAVDSVSGTSFPDRVTFQIRNGARSLMYSKAVSDIDYISFGSNTAPTAKVHITSGNTTASLGSQISALKLDRTTTTAQALDFVISDSGNEINGSSLPAAAKPIIISNTTDSSNTPYTSGLLNIVFNILGNRVLTLKDNGNVGIGTTGAAHKLEVIEGFSSAYFNLTSTNGPIVAVTTSDTTKLVRFIASDGTNSLSLGLRSSSEINNAGFGAQNDTFIYANTNANGLNIINAAGTGSDYIRFYAGVTADTSTAHLHIEGAGTTKGFIGINTETPTTRLHINSATSGAFRLVDGTQVAGRVLTCDANGVATWAAAAGGGSGTVTSVAALTIGTTGADITSTVANSTTTPVITLNIPTASATNRGALSAANWTDFNNKQNAITLTTTGTSGAATFSGGVLNIPNYAGGVTSVFGRTGAVTAQSGDYTTTQVTEGTNLYFTNARGIAATLTSYASTTGTITSADSILTAIQKLNGNVGTKQDIISLTTTGTGAATFIGNVLNIPTPNTFSSSLQHEVKAGVALTKGQAVFVNGVAGTNMVVSKASNAAENTSSKTMGLIVQDLAINGIGQVITEGLLTGTGTAPLDTSAATAAGDPVWLGTDGNLLFGLGNKPVAPAHMVFIGIVTRISATVGEIFVKVQNGFELDELHNVLLNAETDGQVLTYDSATLLWKNKDIPFNYGLNYALNLQSFLL